MVAVLCAASWYAQRSAASGPRGRAAIVGGTQTDIAQLPFLVALFDPGAGSPAAGFFCGGVILDATHVATAAHCVVGERGRVSAPSTIAVLAGSSSLGPLQAGAVIDSVQSVSFDAHYNPLSSDFDVGLLRLARPLWQGQAPSANGASTIAPVPAEASLAAAYGNPNAGQPALVTAGGWGDVNPAPNQPASYPLNLQIVRMPLVPDLLCEEEYAAIEQPITGRMICAGGGRSHRDTCYGDSGGPLLVDRDSPARPPGDLVLVGLVDFGNGCAQSGYAGVYTRVANPEIARFLATGIGRSLQPRASQARHKRKHKRHR